MEAMAIHVSNAGFKRGWDKSEQDGLGWVGTGQEKMGRAGHPHMLTIQRPLATTQL